MGSNPTGAITRRKAITKATISFDEGQVKIKAEKENSTRTMRIDVDKIEDIYNALYSISPNEITKLSSFEFPEEDGVSQEQRDAINRVISNVIFALDGSAGAHEDSVTQKVQDEITIMLCNYSDHYRGDAVKKEIESGKKFIYSLDAIERYEDVSYPLVFSNRALDNDELLDLTQGLEIE